MFEILEKLINKINLPETEFTGYTTLNQDAKVLALYDLEGNEIETLNGKGFAIFNKTPFYALAGGQESDNGYIKKDNKNIIQMLDVRKDVIDGYWIHLIDTDGVILSKNDEVLLEVNKVKRDASSINHSALHTTWQTTLNFVGHKVEEVGSKLNDEKYQLQFENDQKLTEELMMDVTNYLNENVYTKDIPVNIFEVSEEEAKSKGWLYEFTKIKPGEMVRIVDFPGIVLEPCSGTHVHNTNQIHKTFFLYFDSNANRTLIDMTANYEFAKSYFYEKQILRIDEIEEFISKIREIDPNFDIDLDLIALKEEKNWNYLNIKKVNELFNEVVKRFNVLQKEIQKQLSAEMNSMVLEFNSEEIEGLKVKIAKISKPQFNEKILVPRVMKESRDDSSTDIVVLLNETSHEKTMIIVSNKNDLSLNNLFNDKEIGQRFDVKGGGSPKMLVLSKAGEFTEHQLLINLFN